MDTRGVIMFPADPIETVIRDEIRAAMEDRPTPRAAWEPAVDSLVMVRVVLRIEEEFGLNLPDDVMPAGGFGSIDHCVTAVIKTCRELWRVPQPENEEA
jgi:acyl carrier protein